MGALQGYLDTRKALDLETQRAEKLKSMQLNNEIRDYSFDRMKQQNQYQDEKRNEAIARVKEQYKSLSVKTFDDSLVSALKGDLTGLKSVLTNSTDANVNKDIKDALEQDVGGKIIDISHPNPAELQDGEEYSPDEVAVTIITDAGEKQTHLLSLNHLGAVVGTAHRVGMEHYTDLVSGRYKNVSNAGKAILDSIGFDGEMKHLESSLALMSTIGKDAESQKLLNTVREQTSKSGEELIKKLTAEYGNAESPADKAVIAQKLKDVYSMLQATQKKTIKAPKQLSQKDQLIQEYRDAVKNGQLDTASKIEDTYNKFFGKANPLDKEQAKQRLLEKKNKELTDKVKQAFTIDNVYNGTATKSTEELNDYLSRFKTGGRKDAIVTQLADDIVAQDMHKDRVLDLSNPKLRKGRLDEKGKNMLDTLKVLENANVSLKSNTQAGNAVKTLNSAITTITNANNINREYDMAKSRGLFSGIEATGVLTNVRLNVSKWVGDLLGTNLTDEQLSQKVKASMDATLSNLDAYDKLARKSTLTKEEQKLKDDLANKLQIDKTQKWKTETYLVLKKMLQSISGMGVTNQELESFKQAFSGGDQAMLDYMNNQLSYSAEANMKIANTSYNTLTRLGAYYTATNGILRMRANGSYIIDKLGIDVNANIDNKPTFTTLAERLHPQKYQNYVNQLAGKLSIQPSLVDDMISTIYNEQRAGYDMGTFYDRHPNYDPNMVDAIIGSYGKVFSNIDTPTDQPDTTQTTSSAHPPVEDTSHDDRILAQIASIESGGNYGAVNGHAYGKYQLMPKTLEQVAGSLNMSIEEAKTPEGQEKVMRKLLSMHKDELKSMNVPVTDVNIYTEHQLGAGRAKRYFKGTLTNKDYQIMYKNLPKKYKDLLTPDNTVGILEAWNEQYRDGVDGYDTAK